MARAGRKAGKRKNGQGNRRQNRRHDRPPRRGRASTAVPCSGKNFMNLFRHYQNTIIGIIADLAAAGSLPQGLDARRVSVEPPRDASHGDIATNAAMALAKPAGMQPRAIADALAARLATDPRVTGAEVAGPGFLNLRLSPVVWQSVVKAAL